MPINPTTFSMERFFKALSDPTSLRLLNLMGEDEVCVSQLSRVLGHGQANLSQRLLGLRRAGVVAARHDGQWVHYRIVLPRHRGAALVLRDTLASLRNDWRGRIDRRKLALMRHKPEDGLTTPLHVGCRGLRRPGANRLA